jgi:hypothetical protein
MRKTHQLRAFTLLELAVGFMIVAILAALIMPMALSSHTQHANGVSAPIAGSTDGYLFLVLALGAVLALLIMGAWARWHLKRHKAKPVPTASSSVINTSASPLSPKPGWYPNPDAPGDGDVRWWNGTEWAEPSQDKRSSSGAIWH